MNALIVLGLDEKSLSVFVAIVHTLFIPLIVKRTVVERIAINRESHAKIDKTPMPKRFMREMLTPICQKLASNTAFSQFSVLAVNL